LKKKKEKKRKIEEDIICMYWTINIAETSEGENEANNNKNQEREIYDTWHRRRKVDQLGGAEVEAAAAAEEEEEEPRSK